MGARELLLESLQLDAPRAGVGEGLGRPEEEVDDRADERRRKPQQRGEGDEKRVADPPAGVPVHPVGEAEPEDDREGDGGVPGDDEAGRVKEVVEARE